MKTAKSITQYWQINNIFFVRVVDFGSVLDKPSGVFVPFDAADIILVMSLFMDVKIYCGSF